MLCEFCGQPILPRQQVVAVDVCGERKTYHGSPRPDEEHSCWQLTILGWSFAIKTADEARTRHLEVVSD